MVDATRPSRLTASGWLRVALIAGLAASIVSIAFDLAVAERFVDRAVAHESALHHAPLAFPEPFSREGQRGGLVLGELLLGGGIAFLLAGAATFLAPRSRSPRRLWLLMGAACLVGVVLFPALVYPPLPPGVAAGLAMDDRQRLYLLTVGLGIASVATAAHLLPRVRRRVLVALGCIAPPLLFAVFVFPDQQAADTIGSELLAEFRAVSIASQALFWCALTGVGVWLLARRSEV